MNKTTIERSAVKAEIKLPSAEAVFAALDKQLGGNVHDVEEALVTISKMPYAFEYVTGEALDGCSAESVAYFIAETATISKED